MSLSLRNKDSSLKTHRNLNSHSLNNSGNPLVDPTLCYSFARFLPHKQSKELERLINLGSSPRFASDYLCDPVKTALLFESSLP